MAEFDLARSAALLQGAGLDPEPTWQQYKAQPHDWPTTAIVLAVPMIVAAAVLAAVFGALFGTAPIVGVGSFILYLIFMLIMGGLRLAIVGAAFGLLAANFGGKSSFDEGFAIATLAAVPAFAGMVLGTIPWIGWILALVLAIYSLVLLYRGLPQFLDIPQEKRVAHFVVGLIVAFVASFVVSLILGPLFLAGAYGITA